MNRAVRVLIIDDSASVRQTLTDILSADPDIRVIGTASDPYVAARRIQDEVPDVITLDVEFGWVARCAIPAHRSAPPVPLNGCAITKPRQG